MRVGRRGLPANFSPSANVRLETAHGRLEGIHILYLTLPPPKAWVQGGIGHTLSHTRATQAGKILQVIIVIVVRQRHLRHSSQLLLLCPDLIRRHHGSGLRRQYSRGLRKLQVCVAAASQHRGQRCTHPHARNRQAITANKLFLTTLTVPIQKQIKRSLEKYI